MPIDFRPLLNALAYILCRDLDGLCLTRNKYRTMRKLHWQDEGVPIPVETPYDHVITRLEDALNDTYHNLETLEAEARNVQLGTHQQPLRLESSQLGHPVS